MSDPSCHECGTVLTGSAVVEGLCSGCLLLTALRDPESEAAETEARPAAQNERARERTLEPM
jgi:hypothetical protein